MHLTIFLILLLFQLEINASLRESEIKLVSRFLIGDCKSKRALIDSLTDSDLKLVLEEARLKELADEGDIKTIKREFNAYKNKFESAVSRVLSSHSDTTVISFFLRQGYSISNKDFEKQRVQKSGSEGRIEFMKKYPEEKLSADIYNEEYENLKDEDIEDYLLANVRKTYIDTLLYRAKDNTSAKFIKSLLEADTVAIENATKREAVIIKKSDKKFKIKYSVLIPESLRDDILEYYAGRGLEDRKDYANAALSYIKAGDDEALLRIIALMKNTAKENDFADSLLLNYPSSKNYFNYHKAKMLLIKTRNAEAESIFKVIANDFPKNIYSIRSFIYLKKDFELGCDETSADEGIVKLHSVFKNAGRTDLFEKYVFRKTASGSFKNKEAAFTMHALGANNLAIHFAEKSLKEEPLTKEMLKVLYPSPYIENFRKAADKYNVELPLLLAVAREESSFNPNAVSTAGAMGLMQLMNFTYGEYYKDEDYFNIEKNIDAGARHIAAYMKDFPDNPAEGIMSYNAGKGNVKKWKRLYSDWELHIESVPFIETKNYVKRVLRSYYVYKFIMRVS